MGKLLLFICFIADLPSNIDRLFAIWQALNPRAYEIDKEEIDGTFSIAGGTIVNQDTPLPPFNDASGRRYWTSSTARGTEAFNYAYPETQRWRFRSNSDYVDSVEETVFQLYGGISRIFRRGGSTARVASSSNTASTLSATVAEAAQPIVQAVAPAQKPLAENTKSQTSTSAPSTVSSKPAVTSTQSKVPAKEESHGFLSDLGHSVKKLILGDGEDDVKDGTRGDLDFESEIGKRKFQLIPFERCD